MNFFSKLAGAIPGTSQILGIAIGLLVLALGTQTWHVHTLQTKVAEQKALVSQKDAALTVCSNDLALTGKQLAEQSRAVQALQADAAAQAQALQAAEAKATSLQAHSKALESALDAEKVPVDCAGASEWLAEKAAAQAKAFGVWK